MQAMNSTRHDKAAASAVNALRRNHFAVLSTDADGVPHSAGVSYGLSELDGRLTIYVMTRRHLRKARDIVSNPNVSLVVPAPRPLLWFVPPATIQLHGTAEIVDWTDEIGTEVFNRFWIGRRILAAYRQSHRRGETRICFLKIAPDPLVTTYLLGSSILRASKRMESAAATIILPTRAQDPELAESNGVAEDYGTKESHGS